MYHFGKVHIKKMFSNWWPHTKESFFLVTINVCEPSVMLYKISIYLNETFATVISIIGRVVLSSSSSSLFLSWWTSLSIMTHCNHNSDCYLNHLCSFKNMSLSEQIFLSEKKEGFFFNFLQTGWFSVINLASSLNHTKRRRRILFFLYRNVPYIRV